MMMRQRGRYVCMGNSDSDELTEYWLWEELREEDPSWIQEEDATNSEEGEVGVPDLLEENEVTICHRYLFRQMNQNPS